MKSRKIGEVFVMVLLLFVSQKMSAETEEYEQLILLQQYLSEGELTVCILNSGEADTTLVAEYQNNFLVSLLDQSIPSGAELCFILVGTYEEKDDVMLVTQEGTQIKFRAKSGSPISAPPVSTPPYPSSTPETSAETEEYEQFVLQDQYLSEGKLAVCIYNTGNVDVTFVLEYRNSSLVGFLNKTVSSDSVVCFTLIGTYEEGDDVILVTQEGTQIKFRAKSGSPISAPPVSTPPTTPPPTTPPPTTPVPPYSYLSFYTILTVIIILITAVGIFIQTKRKKVKKMDEKRGGVRTGPKSRTLVCPVCRSEIQEDWVSCPYCGVRLKDDTRAY